jgi:hypothetical protein
MTRQIKLIHAFEQLSAIENETDITKKTALIRQYGAVSPLSYILSLNFKHDIILDLPEGMPAIDLKDMDIHTHPDLQGLLGGSIARLKHCLLSSDLSAKKKESILYEVLINCPMKDAEILCSAKDHALEELYPSITSELVASVFPAYVNILDVKPDMANVVEEVKIVKPRKPKSGL